MSDLHADKLFRVERDQTVAAVNTEAGNVGELMRWVEIPLLLPVELKAGITYVLRYTPDATGSYPVAAAITEKGE